VEVEHRLPRALAHVDDHAVVVEPRLACGVGDELEHSLRVLGRELVDLAKARDVPFGQDEQVRLRLRCDVADRDEPVGGVDVIAIADERAEQAVLRQRGSPRR
jgi:hypothetical protein